MLRLKIEGSWEPEHFISVIKGVESLYYKAAMQRRSLHEPPFYWYGRPEFASSFEESMDYTNDWLLAQARTIAPAEIRLRINRIQYASPGGIDLVGIGKATEAVRGVVDSLIKFFTEKEIRKQANAKAKIDTEIRGVDLEKEHESLRALKIANARAILDLRRDYPDIPLEMLMAVIVRDQDMLIPAISSGKLVGVERYEGKTPESPKES